MVEVNCFAIVSGHEGVAENAQLFAVRFEGGCSEGETSPTLLLSIWCLLCLGGWGLVIMLVVVMLYGIFGYYRI